jgi:transposase
MRKERQHYTAEEKVAILRRHLLDKVPVSDLSEELGLQPTVFYRWQKELFENGASAFQAKERPARQVEEKQKRIEFLEKKVQTKDEVLPEPMAELGGRLLKTRQRPRQRPELDGEARIQSSSAEN